VSPGEDRQSDDVDVLLDGRVGDRADRLVTAGVDDLHPRIAQGLGHHLGPAVVAVEPRLGDEHTDGIGHRRHGTRRRLPNWSQKGAEFAIEAPHKRVSGR
jgi:hypothetical protein